MNGLYLFSKTTLEDIVKYMLPPSFIEILESKFEHFLLNISTSFDTCHISIRFLFFLKTMKSEINELYRFEMNLLLIYSECDANKISALWMTWNMGAK